MSTTVSAPPQNEFLDPRSMDGVGSARPTTGWTTYFSSAYALLVALSSSGTTAQRPITFLFVGRTYFDSTLGKPIWVKSVAVSVATWVDATGAAV